MRRNFESWQEFKRRFDEGRRWRLSGTLPADQTFDIRKTDSLISPAVGYIEFKLFCVQSDRLTQADAQVATQDRSVTQYVLPFRIDYAFQDNVWVIMSISRKEKPTVDELRSSLDTRR